MRKDQPWRVLAICGSTRALSANGHLLRHLQRMAPELLQLEIYWDIASLPHFNPDDDGPGATPPAPVANLRQKIAAAEGVIICTPEYVFSLPGAFKNAMEWCVSTTVFTAKPTALITASASGAIAHQSLQLVMKTVGADLMADSQLLISGVKGKFDAGGALTDAPTAAAVDRLLAAFIHQMETQHGRSA